MKRVWISLKLLKLVFFRGREKERTAKLDCESFRVSYTDCETAGTEPLSLELRVGSTVDVRGVPGSNPGKINEVLSR